MKILFTADWHIKLGQKHVPVIWAKNRYREFFAKLHVLERDYDLHIIGGDIFDRLPTMPELELYFEYISEVKTPTIIYDGNHEATKKGHTFLSQLKHATSRISHHVAEIIDSATVLDEFSILPYCELRTGAISRLPKDRIVFTHVRGAIPPHVIPEINLDLFDEFPMVIAGDLHAHSNSQGNIIYPGAPMTVGFHRNPVETGYLEVEPKHNSWDWHKICLPQLIRKTVQSEEEMVSTKRDYTIYELEGDLAKLSKVNNSELLDKKLIKRNSESALILDASMSMSDELREYLSYILELDDDIVNEAIGVFNDNIKEVEMG